MFNYWAQFDIKWLDDLTDFSKDFNIINKNWYINMEIKNLLYWNQYVWYTNLSENINKKINKWEEKFSL